MEDSNAEVGKQPTPSSTFKPLVETIFEDQIVVNSNLHEDDANPQEDDENYRKILLNLLKIHMLKVLKMVNNLLMEVMKKSRLQLKVVKTKCLMGQISKMVQNILKPMGINT